MNLLIYQGALGDWVLTFPILRALTEPTVVITSSSKAKLAANLFDHVQAMDIEMREFSQLYTPGGPVTLGPTVQNLVDSASMIISFVSNGGDAWGHNIRRVAPHAKTVFIEPRPPRDWQHHVCAWHEQQFKAQGVMLNHVPIATRHVPDGDVLIHPGSGGADKCWPLDRYDRLIEELKTAGKTVQVVVGEVELDTWSKQTLAEWRNRHGTEPLRSLEALQQQLSAANRYVGNDCGPTHLAAQMGVPTVALFGPTSPICWGPRGSDVTILAPPEPRPMTWLKISMVLAAIANKP